jgi:hypothetical protein
LNEWSVAVRTRNDLLEVLDDRVGSRSTIIINSMGKKNKPDDALA